MVLQYIQGRYCFRLKNLYQLFFQLFFKFQPVLHYPSHKPHLQILLTQYLHSFYCKQRSHLLGSQVVTTFILELNFSQKCLWWSPGTGRETSVGLILFHQCNAQRRFTFVYRANDASHSFTEQSHAYYIWDFLQPCYNDGSTK